MLRIGLTQRVEVLTERDEGRDCLDQAWTHLLIDNGYWPIPLPNCVENVGGLVETLSLDGVIMTGGNDLDGLPCGVNTAPQRDAFERKLLNYCTKRHIPLLGVCRGLQMLAAHYGGMLVREAGHVACSHPIHIEPDFVAVFGERDQVNSYHDWGILEEGLCADLQIAAIAPNHTVEAVVHKKNPQIGIMWHPERVSADDRDIQLIHELFAGVYA